jgi:hypothetical protein
MILASDMIADLIECTPRVQMLDARSRQNMLEHSGILSRL